MQISRTASAAQSSAGNGVKSSGEVTQEDFLKLLIAQLSHQDPLNPTADTEFLGQLAQFTSLEEMRNLNTSFKTYSGQGELGQMASLIGKQVLVQPDKEAEAVTGIVQAVNRQNGKFSLIVNNQAYKPEDVIQVY
ncbi:MAG: flagellar hook capping protein [Armatimonadetes bacterium]|nr:flagellar hook capping protein [Armatimonadota bacterium]